MIPESPLARAIAAFRLERCRREIALLIVLAGMTTSPVGAQQLSQSGMEEGADTPAVQAEPGMGAWRIRRSGNPIDGTRTVEAWVSANVRSARGEQILFVARCESGTTAVYIVWGDYMADQDPALYPQGKYVTIRVGPAEPEVQRWRLSIDDEATFAPGSGIELLREMASADFFVAETAPFEAEPLMAIFNTEGMASAMKEIAEPCGWSLE